MTTVHVMNHLHTSSRRKLIRLVLIALVMLAVLSCGALVQAYAGSREDASNVVTVSNAAPAMTAATYEVDEGDSLWSIARSHAPKNVSTRNYIDKLMKLNGLNKSDLKVGQLLILP